MSGTLSAIITDAERGIIAREVRGTIARIAATKFECDPLVVPDASLASSAISSAYKRHGLILEKALLAALSTRADLKAWSDRIAVPKRRSPIQIDLIVYAVPNRTLTAYEIKRGFGSQDSEAQHSIVERMSSLEAEHLNYGIGKGFHPDRVSVAVIGYYGRLGATVGPHRVIDQCGLAKEFDIETAAFVCEVNEYFRHCLLRHTAPNFARALTQIGELALFRDVPEPLLVQSEAILHAINAAHHPWDDLGE